MKKATQKIHLALLSFLGLTAMLGGGALIISPSGKLLGGLPLSILENSPFPDFLISGIILFLVLGLFPLLIVMALIKRPFIPLQNILMFLKTCTGLGLIVFI